MYSKEKKKNVILNYGTLKRRERQRIRKTYLCLLKNDDLKQSLGSYNHR